MKIKIDINSCRVCLENVGVIPIFHDHGDEIVSKMISSLFNIDVIYDENLPTTLCTNCLENIKLCILTKNIIVNSESMLNTYLKSNLTGESAENLIQIKVELDDPVKTPELIELEAEEIKIERSEVSCSSQDTENKPCGGLQIVQVQSLASLNPEMEGIQKEIRSDFKIESTEPVSKILRYEIEMQKRKKTGQRAQQRARKKEKMTQQELADKKAKESQQRAERRPRQKAFRSVHQSPFISKKSKTIAERVQEFRARKRAKKPFDMDGSRPNVHDISTATSVNTSIKVQQDDCILNETPTGIVPGQETKRCPVRIKPKEVLAVQDIRATNLKEKTFLCSYCDIPFSYLRSLKAHMKVHFAPETKQLLNGQNTNKHKCDLCSQNFSTANSLKRHKISHSGLKEQVCPHCGKKFALKDYLKLHIQLIHNTDDPRNFKCNICGVISTSFSKSKKHLLTHNRGNPFPCKFCGWKFLHSTSLEAHIKEKHFEAKDDENKI